MDSATLQTALAGVEASVVLDGFYTVLPLVIACALPIISAKIGLNFLFHAVKGA